MTPSQKFPIGLLLVLLTAVTAHAGILLSGTTSAFFQPVSNPYATVTNSASGSDASFRTGIPVDGSFKSGVKFSGQSFVNLEDGDSFSLGSIRYYNGLSRVGTSSGSSLLDLYLNFDDPALGKVHLATINFGIDATINRGGASASADLFTATFAQPPPIWLGDELVKFSINGLPKSTWVTESNFMNLADITVTVLIPENSTCAAILGAAVLVFSLYFRRQALPLAG